MRYKTLTVLLLFMTACTRSSASSPAPATFPDPPPSTASPASLETAVFAGGCFWGVEAVFESLKGVTSAVSGYAGGTSPNPTYEEVCTGTTGYAESVQVTFDPKIISYGTLLKIFFSVAHDPTELNRQGPDVGTNYRSAIFTESEAQAQQAKQYIQILTEKKAFPRPIVTQVVPLTKFYSAEAYHQHYLEEHPDSPYIVQCDLPKLSRLVRMYPELVKPGSPAATDTPTKVWHGLIVLQPDQTPVVPVQHSDTDWKHLLGNQAWGILRRADTEAPFTGAYWNEHRPGTYYSAATGEPLFRSQDKFDSGCGWPSFSKPITSRGIILRQDNSHGMSRIEVLDSSSGSHLGHVFNDGPDASKSFPEGTGLRYCINSAAMIFVPDGAPLPPLVAAWKAAHPTQP